MHVRVLSLLTNLSLMEKDKRTPLLLPHWSSHGPECSQRVDFTLCQLSAKTVDPCLRGCAPSCAVATCACVDVCVRERAFLTLRQKQHY